MPTAELAKQAEAVRADIARLEADLKTLLTTVGGAVGATINGRIREPMSNISTHIEPLLNMLGAAMGDTPIPIKRGLGRPKKAEGEAPKRPRRRGGRGKKVNLTAEKIAAALKETGGNKSAAARVLGVSLPTFYKYHGAAPAERMKAATKPAAVAAKKAKAPAKAKTPGKAKK